MVEDMSRCLSETGGQLVMGSSFIRKDREYLNNARSLAYVNITCGKKIFFKHTWQRYEYLPHIGPKLTISVKTQNLQTLQTLCYEISKWNENSNRKTAPRMENMHLKNSCLRETTMVVSKYVSLTVEILYKNTQDASQGSSWGCF